MNPMIVITQLLHVQNEVELSHTLPRQAALGDGFNNVYSLLPQQYWLLRSLSVGLWENK